MTISGLDYPLILKKTSYMFSHFWILHKILGSLYVKFPILAIFEIFTIIFNLMMNALQLLEWV